ncbi:glutathione S-transferase [Leptospira tipperaryensis]|uniref:Glutathione S-transferase n=1 Tax=Leptospira tipperaryensis TaxID=2564040 RepID=A0A1D7UYC3_9LEPT|nr:glutathione S-transferase family protein [Leptospira tipperaryensis]AOP34571.1 glutathione S-transferase [Leptospira tipperaryensis]
MYKVFGMKVSGNCHKVKSILTLLDLPFEWIELDTRKGETKTEEFLKINPNGKIPVLQWNDEINIPESNAILYYLARDTKFFSQDLLEQTRILEWLFFEQYSHEPFVAVNRWLLKFTSGDVDPQQIKNNHTKGMKAFSVMEAHLKDKNFFVGNRLTIADLALYAYSHVAEDGGFSLEDFPSVSKWLHNVKSYPKMISIESEE